MSSIFDSLRNFLKSKKSEHARQRPLQTLVADNGMSFKVDQVKRGGMGIVYICHIDPKLEWNANPRLALKTFDERFFFNADMSMAVERETAIWAQLSDQPFIFPLITTLSIDHKPYLVMPVAEPDERGVVSLSDAIRQSPEGLSPNECLLLALCLSITLSAAAGRIPGLVHGDIKPDNILFLGGFPFLADFGLARLAGDRGHGGTPPYMAPELWKEDGRQSVKTDIYAFGATLFESLSGRLPFLANENNPEQWAALHSSKEPCFDIDGDSQQSLLRSELQKLTLRCLAKPLADRPNDFKEIYSELFALAMRADPATLLEVLQKTVGLSEIIKDQRHSIIETKVSGFLQQGQYHTAIKLLSTLPEDEIAGNLLLLAGSTYSLNGDDEKALHFFDRFLESNPEPEQRVRCLNERGLSLRRLGRLEEAKYLFEHLLETARGQLRVMVRGNYAGALLELNETKEAVKQLEWLTRNHPESHEGWALYSDALDRSGEIHKSIDTIQKAIQRAPRNGIYYVTLAELLFRLQRINESLAALSKAYELGHHTRAWLKLTIANHLILGQTDTLEHLLDTVQQELSKEEIDAVFRESLELVRLMVDDQEDLGISDEAISQTPDLETSETLDARPEAHGGGSEDKPYPDAVVAADKKSEIDDTRIRSDKGNSEENFMELVRTGRQSHIQLRMSFVDNSFSIDFYFDVNSPEYVRLFKYGYDQAKWRFETMAQGVSERETKYRFAQCQNCKFILLTARDEEERFQCKACGIRGPVKSIRTDHLDALSSDCEQAIGRHSEKFLEEAPTLFVAFWVNESAQEKAVGKRMENEGFNRVPPKATAVNYFEREMNSRGDLVSSPPTQVWYKALTKSEEVIEGRTPAFLDRIIRELRRKTGHLISASQAIQDQEMIEFLLCEAEGRAKIARDQVAKNPDDDELKQTLVKAELEVGNLKEAKRIAAAMEMVDPNDLHALRATAEVAMAERRFSDAILRLERIIDARPRDQSARILLINAYFEIGDKARAAEHIAQYIALGGKMPKQDAD
jgi:serine/threonine protein kinase/cytochrome c-type biogenesis protein CcmH/NrfG